MQFVTDSGVDLNLSPEEQRALRIRVVPLTVQLEGQSYREGVDITADDFYRRLIETGAMPTTSQPSPGDFETVYRELAAEDPEILSIHISSGLSGTLNSARTAAAAVPSARITLVDTKTLSAGVGSQVEAAARALKAGWPLQSVLDTVRRIQEQTHSFFTLRELKYLIHGGRISHMKGLLASVLNIKPIIGVEKERGTYVTLGQARSFNNAIKAAGEIIHRRVTGGVKLRAQVVHADNPEGAQQLMDEVKARFNVEFVPVRQLSLVLGAHVGRSMIGVCYAPLDVFPAIV